MLNAYTTLSERVLGQTVPSVDKMKATILSEGVLGQTVYAPFLNSIGSISCMSCWNMCTECV